MFLYTLRNPDKVAGLIGVATGADFTQRVWKSLSKQKRLEVQRTGVYDMPSEYCPDPIPLSMELFQDGEKYTILDMPGIQLLCIYMYGYISNLDKIGTDKSIPNSDISSFQELLILSIYKSFSSLVISMYTLVISPCELVVVEQAYPFPACSICTRVYSSLNTCIYTYHVHVYPYQLNMHVCVYVYNFYVHMYLGG